MENVDENRENGGKGYRKKPMDKNMAKLRELRGSEILKQERNAGAKNRGGMEDEKLLGNGIRQKLNKEKGAAQKTKNVRRFRAGTMENRD